MSKEKEKKQNAKSNKNEQTDEDSKIVPLFQDCTYSIRPKILIKHIR